MKQIIKFITVPVLALICSVTALGQSNKSSIYTSNVTLPTSGTNASSCKVVINSTEYDGTKLGTSSKAGSASFSVPAGTKYIHLHVAAWNGKSPGFKYKVGNGSETTISGITSNSGIASNSPFTWSTSSGNQNPNSSYHYKVICLSTALASETSITFISSSERVVFWGVNTETETVPSHTLTYSASNGSIAGVDSESNVVASGDSVPEGSTVTLTATPSDGYAFSSWSISGTGSTLSSTTTNPTTFTMGTANATVIANFEDSGPKPTHTATFSVNGNTSSEDFAEGAAISFPDDPDDVNGKTFAGWVTAEIDGVTDSEPSFVSSATMGTSDVVYYAVFATKDSSGAPVETKTQTLQYDSWTYSGTTSDKTSYRLFGKDSYIESSSFDLSKLSKVIVYGGTYGGASYNSLTIGDGTNTWKDVTVSGSSQTGTNTYTGGTDLSGTKPLRIISNSGNASSTGVRISKVEIFTNEPTVAYSGYCTTVPAPALVATPSFSPAEGEVISGTTVTISCATAGAVIYYTKDGSIPTSASTEYSTPVEITSNTTLKAIAMVEDVASDVASATYTVVLPVATPTFTPVAGTYTWAQSITISTETEGATIYYTIDGTTPTSSSTEFTEAISVSSTTTIKAIAIKDGMADSDVASATYTMSIPSISASDINLAYDATSGSIAFSITNPVEGGVLTAEITAGNTDSWMSLGEVGESVAITCSENESETDERTATVTLTYTYNTDKTVSKDVVITQEKSVIDYAELPFSFDNGRGDLTTGLTQSGLGSDYNSSPKLKFDSSDDYVILKIKEDPGTLSFDIKGNSFSGGTFKIQTSVDGSDYSDLKTYTSLGDTQTEEFTNLESDVRYIKWIYTNKSSGNVALGKINLKKDTPFINLSSYSINVTDAEAEGILSATYKKVVAENSSDLEIQWFGKDGETPAEEPDWALVEINDDLNVDYFIEENTEDKARTAYFKVYGIDEEAGDVYSSLVAINQAAMSVASLPFSFTGGRSAIESTAGLTENGLGTDYGNNNPPLKFDDEGDYVLLHITGAPASLSFDIRNNGFSGGTFIVQTSADGKTYNELLSYKSLEGTQNESCDLPSNVRFIKWVYSSKVNGNVGLGNISVTAFDPSASSITLGAALNNGRYWVSFYNKFNRYILPSGSEAYTINSSNQLFRLGTDGSVIPAGTAVIIIADSASITLTKSNDESAVAVNGFTNILQGSNSPVTVSEIVGTPYVLGIKNGVLGFYEFVGETLPANKAYYVVNE